VTAATVCRSLNRARSTVAGKIVAAPTYVTLPPSAADLVLAESQLLAKTSPIAQVRASVVLRGLSEIRGE
jgi:hypothetical protein